MTKAWSWLWWLYNSSPPSRIMTTSTILHYNAKNTRTHYFLHSHGRIGQQSDMIWEWSGAGLAQDLGAFRARWWKTAIFQLQGKKITNIFVFKRDSLTTQPTEVVKVTKHNKLNCKIIFFANKTGNSWHWQPCFNLVCLFVCRRPPSESLDILNSCRVRCESSLS